jgi:hypothetical protein
MDRATFARDLTKHGAPPGSSVVMTPSAYMTDVAWMDVVPLLCKGLRAMPVVKDHPDDHCPKSVGTRT